MLTPDLDTRGETVAPSWNRFLNLHILEVEEFIPSRNQVISPFRQAIGVLFCVFFEFLELLSLGLDSVCIEDNVLITFPAFMIWMSELGETETGLSLFNQVQSVWQEIVRVAGLSTEA